MFAGHTHPDSNALGCNRKYWSHSGGWISQGMNMGEGISWMDGCMGESNMEYLMNSDIDTRWAVCENFLFSEDFVQRIYEVKTLRQGRVEMWSEDRQDNGETGSRFLTSQWENATRVGFSSLGIPRLVQDVAGMPRTSLSYQGHFHMRSEEIS